MTRSGPYRDFRDGSECDHHTNVSYLLLVLVKLCELVRRK